MSPETGDALECRLCGGHLRWSFQLKVLGKYPVDYLTCSQCRSLQTQAPFWLDEAYRSNLADLDTGAGQRILANLAAAYAVAKVLGLKNALDFGGGDGLLCRLLRDYRINAFVSDAHAVPTYAPHYTRPDFARPDLLLSFEVFEHFANPREDLQRVFSHEPDVACISTLIYREQDSTWWYLAPETGQHVFFYSKEAIAWIARRFGYREAFASNYVLFYRAKRWRRLRIALLTVALKPIPLRLILALLTLMPPSGRKRDFERLRSGDHQTTS